MITFSYLLMTLLGFAGLFLIGLILLQRGRGGGLAGAFGGIGGQSAFGTKAGDVFTKITIGVASAWILLCAGSVVALHNSTVQRATGFADPAQIKVEDAKADAANAGRDAADMADEDDNLKLDVPVQPANPKPDAEKPAGEQPAGKTTEEGNVKPKDDVPAAPTNADAEKPTAPTDAKPDDIKSEEAKAVDSKSEEPK